MSLDRILDSFKALVREMLAPDVDDVAPAWSAFVGWEYQVAEVTETTFSGRATSSRCPWPDMVKIPLMPGVAGTLIKPAADSLVTIVFVNGDPSRPRCMSWDQAFAQRLALQSAVSGNASSALTVDITPAGAQVYDLANTPPAQAVALAPPVSSFATAETTFMAAAAVFAAALGVVIATIPATTAPQLATFASALTVYQSALGAYISAVSALGGTFPTGFAATKFKTQ